MGARTGRIRFRLNYNQLELNAGLCYAVTKVRDNAESIALCRGEQPESNRTISALKKLLVVSIG